MRLDFLFFCLCGPRCWCISGGIAVMRLISAADTAVQDVSSVWPTATVISGTYASLIISWEARPPHFTASGFLALPLNTYLSSPAVCCALPNSSSSCSTPDVQTETSPDSALRNSVPRY